MIPKPNNSPRLIYDARAANYFLSQLNYILPNLQDPLIRGFKFVAKVDLTHSFMHLPIDEKFQSVCGFKGPDGTLYRWIKLVWGSSCAPFIMQRFSEIFTVYVNKHTNSLIIVYADDFLILANEYHDCLTATSLLVKTLEKAGVEINADKS